MNTNDLYHPPPPFLPPTSNGPDATLALHLDLGSVVKGPG